MRFLYVFPHPDDESFGPALVISKQKREGHEVHLLTLTRGGATKQRHRFGYSVEEMGRVRLEEMQCVEKVLDLDSMTVLDLPDGGLDGVPANELHDVVGEAIDQVDPDVVVTYAAHGISGHPDHVRTNEIVTTVFDAKRGGSLRRLALFTLLPAEGKDELKTSRREDVDCAVEVTDADLDRTRKALACYETYAETIRKKDPLGRIGSTVYFEFYEESHDPWLEDLTGGLEA